MGLCGLLIGACTLSRDTSSTGALPTAPLPTALMLTEPTPDTAGWDVIAPGLEMRTLNTSDIIGQTQVIRIDPARYRFRAHYRPGDPLRLSGWRDTLPDAVALINANFFDPQFFVLGLLVADGVVYGQSYVNRGGMFTVIGDAVRVRSNTREPYAGETLDQAVQAFPMLVVDGQPVFTNESGDRITRRSAIAQDTQGRILLLSTPLFGLTLADLSALLAQAELNIDIAFNLDGGGSTMLYASEAYSLASLDAVPSVLAVYAR